LAFFTKILTLLRHYFQRHLDGMSTLFRSDFEPELYYQSAQQSKKVLSPRVRQHVSAYIIDAGFNRESNYADDWITSEVGNDAQPKPFVMVLGLRGFPEVQGGIERHAEQLCPILVNMGCRVEVLVRARYQSEKHPSDWKGVQFTRIWSPKSKAFEAIAHTFLGVMYAAMKRPDILHIHAVGPALMTPLARLFGLKVIVTHHGPDYDRQKWSYFAKLVLKFGEWMGMRFSNGRIAISSVISEIVQKKYAQSSDLIVNGVDLPNLDSSDNPIQPFGLEKNKYILSVSRFVPEKRHLDLIHAFNLANIPDCKLVLVGTSDHPDAYMESVRNAARENPNIVLTGFQKGDALKSLYTHAGLFVLPSSHEGLSISLLEALSYGLLVVASDIPANLEVGLEQHCYYALGDCNALAEKMGVFFKQQPTAIEKSNTRLWLSRHYDWRHVAEKTLNAYQRVIKSHPSFIR